MPLKDSSIQLFREWLSGKVHATIPKGIVGGFEFSFLKRNLKEFDRFDSYSRQEQCIDHIPYYLSGLSRAHFFPTTFLEIAVFNSSSTVTLNPLGRENA